MADQMCFTSESLCTLFKPHLMKANMCTECMKEITKHSPSVVSDEDVKKAFEFTLKGERIPSLVLDSVEPSCFGKLFLGGFKAVLNDSFLKEENICGVVNTAGCGLFSLFGKSFQTKYEKVLEVFNIECLSLRWEDSISYDISDDDLEAVIRFIHDKRNVGKSVLVHCAQGKSRSSTAVVAYIMVVMKLPLKESLDFVQHKRKMADPNSHFVYLLHEFESSATCAQLRNEII